MERWVAAAAALILGVGLIVGILDEWFTRRRGPTGHRAVLIVASTALVLALVLGLISRQPAGLAAAAIALTSVSWVQVNRWLFRLGARRRLARMRAAGE